MILTSIKSYLGDKMSLMDEYARNRGEKAVNRYIETQLKAGMRPEFISSITKIPLSRVKEIEKTLNP